MKWTSLVLIIDGSNYETMSAANEDHYDPSQPQPMYWEVSVLQKIESGQNFEHSRMTWLFSGRGPGVGARGASAGLPGGGHCPLPHLLQVSITPLTSPPSHEFCTFQISRGSGRDSAEAGSPAV